VELTLYLVKSICD